MYMNHHYISARTYVCNNIAAAVARSRMHSLSLIEALALPV